MKAPKYISRLDVAWRVKVKQGDWTQTKHFNFEKYGGVKHALNKAIEWRDQLLEKRGMLPYVDRTRSPALSCKRKSSTYPCIGVHLNGDRNWTSIVQINKSYIKQSFSVNKWGNKFAFLLACETRYLNNGTLIVINKKAMPCKPDVPYIIKG